MIEGDPTSPETNPNTSPPYASDPEVSKVRFVSSGINEPDAQPERKAATGHQRSLTLKRSLSTNWKDGKGDENADDESEMMLSPAMPKPGYGPGGPVQSIQPTFDKRRVLEVRPQTTQEMLMAGLSVPPWQMFKYKSQKIMQSWQVTLFMLIITVWALFGADIIMMMSDKTADPAFETVSIILFIVFMVELIINSLTQDKYFLSFFWFLDLVAALSMLLDVESIRDAIMGTDDNQDLTVARAGRAARAGTRAGRLLKMTRLLRVIKLFRTVNREKKEDVESTVEHADALGTRVAEMTTNKVVCGVLIMLVVFPLLSPSVTNSGPGFILAHMHNSFNSSRCVALKHIDCRAESTWTGDCDRAITNCTGAQSQQFQSSLLSFTNAYSARTLQLRLDCNRDKATKECTAGVVHLVKPKDTRALTLRNHLEKHYETAYVPGRDINPDAAALFDDEDRAGKGALLSLLTTLLVVVVLGYGSFTFGKDASNFSDLIAGPMKALCEDMEHVANLEYIDVVHPPCAIVEVMETQRAFHKMKGGLQTFAKYVPRTVVRQLTSEGKEANLGISDIEMSFFFCDIQGFTTVCEAMNSRPDDLLKFLGEFFAEMAAIIEDTGGTVIEYIGDAILACWNDRPEKPVADHAFAAASASFRMRLRLEEMHPIWQRKFPGGPKGPPPIYLRTGVHTGHSWVGFIGSQARMKYGLLGDHVNVAMELEEINKHYNTFTLISEMVAANPRVAKTFVMRPVDVVHLEGVSDAAKLYEIIAVKPGLEAGALYITPPNEAVWAGLTLTINAVAPSALVDYFAKHTQAMDAYLERNFDGCLKILQEMQELNGEPANVDETRKKERHQGAKDGSTEPQYLADDLKIYVPSGVHPTPPGTWPGPDGDVAAATLRYKARTLQAKGQDLGSEWAGVFENSH
eukprot:COSAG05_NODE_39_length_27555_cov_750.282925_5_plen_914_part_00